MRRILSAVAALAMVLSANIPATARGAKSVKSPVVQVNAPLTVKAEQVAGDFAVHVFGHGPASTTVHLLLQNWISRDLPALPIGSSGGFHDVATDQDGNFTMNVALSSTLFEGSLVTVDATTTDEGYHASANYFVDVPSPGIHTNADKIPKN